MFEHVLKTFCNKKCKTQLAWMHNMNAFKIMYVAFMLVTLLCKVLKACLYVD